MDFSLGSIVASLLFSSVGFVAFSYGKKLIRYRLIGMGVALMAYSYFTRGVFTWIVGAGLSGGLYYFWDWLNES